MTDPVDTKETTIRGELVIIKFYDIRNNTSSDDNWRVMGDLQSSTTVYTRRVGDDIAEIVDAVERDLANKIEKLQEHRRELHEAKETFRKKIEDKNDNL